MKQKILFLAVFLLFSVDAYSAIKVKFFLGEVEYMPKTDTAWKKVTMGQKIQVGDSIRTGAKAYIELDLDNNYIKINENTKIKISENVGESKTANSVMVQYGNVLSKIEKIKKDDKGFEIRTASSIAGVRGTEFTVLAGHDGTTVVQVVEGTVAFTGDKKQISVSANQESTVPLGGDPSPVKVIEKRQWNEWLAESEKKIKGNEENLLENCLDKMKKLDSEIAVLESVIDKSRKEQKEYDEKMQEAINNKDKDKAKEFAELSYKSGRTANSNKAKAYYQSDRMSIVKGLADKIYSTAAKGSASKKMEAANMQIQEIYNQQYNKYMLEIKKSKEKK